MRFLVMVLALVLIVPSVSLAAYQAPEATTKTRLPGGQTKITYEFKGDAGEPTVTRSYVTNRTVTTQAVREWVAETIKELDLLQSVDALPALQVGAKPTPANRASAVKTAKQVWREKYAAYLAAKDSGLAGAVSADLAALKADLEATYQAGFLTE